MSPIFEWVGSRYSEPHDYTHPDHPRTKFAFSDRDLGLEMQYLYALATRYKSARFTKNLVKDVA